LIWIDAHGDFNTAETTPSGNIHGMPLAALCGLGDRRLTHLWDEAVPVLSPQRVAVIAVRDLHPGEKTLLRLAGVMVFSMEQIDRLGMTQVMERALDHVSRDVEGIYLSLDMDALDPRHAPEWERL
jgi:arginase (EC 3.5.3.1)